MAFLFSTNLQADIQEAGNIIQILVLLGALAGTYIADDSEGRIMFTNGFALKGSYWTLKRCQSSKGRCYEYITYYSYLSGANIKDSELYGEVDEGWIDD